MARVTAFSLIRGSGRYRPPGAARALTVDDEARVRLHQIITMNARNRRLARDGRG
jgi:hypothetical protein